AMITEIAQIDVKPGMEAEFEAGVKKAATIFQRAKGCHGMDLSHSIEKPARYRLFVKWATVENHTVDFRGSPDFQEWRKLVGHCFASPPEWDRAREVVKGFYRRTRRASSRLPFSRLSRCPILDRWHPRPTS